LNDPGKESLTATQKYMHSDIMHMMHNTITNCLLPVTASNWMAVMRYRWLKMQKCVYTCSENSHYSVTEVLRN